MYDDFVFSTILSEFHTTPAGNAAIPLITTPSPGHRKGVIITNNDTAINLLVKVIQRGASVPTTISTSTGNIVVPYGTTKVFPFNEAFIFYGEAASGGASTISVSAMECG